jgi:hypothetical protein
MFPYAVDKYLAGGRSCPNVSVKRDSEGPGIVSTGNGVSAPGRGSRKSCVVAILLVLQMQKGVGR